MRQAKRRRAATNNVQFRAPPRTCGYFGEPATTRDHVPPKAILRKPFPRLITVPACQSCNARWGNGLDELYRNFLSLRIGTARPDTQDFWNSRVEPGMRYGGPPTRLKVSEHDQWTEMTASGPVPRTDKLIGVDASCHREMIERLVRGLYYHQYGHPIGLTTKVQTSELADHGLPMLEPIFRPHERHSVGPDFEFWATRLDEEVASSMWFFRMYGVFCSLAATGHFAETALAAGHGKGPGVQLLINNGVVTGRRIK